MKLLRMKNTEGITLLLMVCLSLVFVTYFSKSHPPLVKKETEYWLLLLRKSNTEFLYKGVPGERTNSILVKTFQVKSGTPQERPTPLPQKLGKKYWLITKKEPTDNPETAPYFLTLDVPGVENEPFGPVPYNECNGKQCNWVLPGAFGLHGVRGDKTRLTEENAGSSGCIRHSDEDITYLYKLLSPEKSPIRYYIQDS